MHGCGSSGRGSGESKCEFAESPLGVPRARCANSEREEMPELAEVRVGAVVSGVVQLGRPRRLQLRYQLELLVAILIPEITKE